MDVSAKKMGQMDHGYITLGKVWVHLLVKLGEVRIRFS